MLGVLSRGTSTLRQEDSDPGFSETVTVNVPPGTRLIVPAMRGWRLGYGHTVPEDLSPDPDSGSSVEWLGTDEHLGLAGINISVQRVHAVDESTSPPTQTAEIQIAAILGDRNLDNEWWAQVNYMLICLGTPPE